ncbi:MAG TPA: glycine cleavage system aminomethyltransferase GcvT [Nocardioides sp.]
MAATPDATALIRSPLHDRHVALGAKLAAFGGWAMPVEYGAGTAAEHAAVRERVGIFDVSHLGKASMRGAGAAAYVDSVLTNGLGRIGVGQAQYTLCCAPDGGVVDDLIVYLRGDDDVFLVPNAANTAAVVEVLRSGAPDGVTVTDEHRDHVVLAVQGPASDAVLEGAGLPAGHEYMSFRDAVLPGADVPVVVCRTGYTGERGYEVVAPVAVAEQLWDALVAAGEAHGLLPAGLGARDTLRTEMGYPLHGQDISPTITPVQARLGWAVGWDKPAFAGREALLAERAAGPTRVLRGLRAVRRGIPRPGMRVLGADDAELGTVTSGTFSPSLRTGIALALLDRSVAEGDEVVVDVRGRSEAFIVVRPPFVEASAR